MTITDLLSLLRSDGLLPPDVAAALPGPHDTVPALLRELVQRGLLTTFQVNEISKGRGSGLFLGPYVLLELLGKGGMGQVCKARQLRLNRVEAVKLIREDLLAHPSSRERFQREMQAVAQLHHPNIVQAYSAGQDGERHYFAMEYLEGRDLARVLKDEGPLSLTRACAYAYQVAQGLQHAYEHGLIHRDLKPLNLMLTGAPHPALPEWKHGLIKVLDFGLARLREGTEGPTIAGTILGTPGYMAPEQLVFGKVDIRTDLFALGCTLCYLLTGAPPFPAGSVEEARHRQQAGLDAALAQLPRPVPIEALPVLRQLLAFDPEQRPPSPNAVTTRLAPFLDGVSSVTAETIPPSLAPAPDIQNATAPYQPAATSQRKRWLIPSAVGAIAALVLIIVLAKGANNGSSRDEDKKDEEKTEKDKDDKKDPPPVKQGLARLSADKIADEERFEGMPQELVAVFGSRQGRHWGALNHVFFTPDGRSLVTGGDDGVVRIWDIMPHGEEKKGLRERVVMTGHKGPVKKLVIAAKSPASDDLPLLASLDEDGALRLWNSRGKLLHTEALGRSEVIIALSKDGELFAEARGRTVRIWETSPWKLLQKWDESYTGTVKALSFSPDGSKLALASGESGSFRNYSFRFYDTTTGNLIGDNVWTKSVINFLGYLNSGEVLTLQGLKLTRWKVGNQKGTDVGDLDGSMRNMVLSPDETLALSVRGNKEVRLFNIPKAKSGPTVSLQVGAINHAALSPDSKTLALVSNLGVIHLWDCGVDAPYEVTSAMGHEGALTTLALAPDEEALATTGPDGTVRIWNWHGAQPRQHRLLRPYGESAFLAFVPGKRELLTWTPRDEGQANVYDVTDWNPRKVKPLFKAEGKCAVLSPDGKLLLTGTRNTLAEWDLATGQRFTDRMQLQALYSFQAIALSADGTHVAANKNGESAGPLVIWSMESGKPLPTWDKANRPREISVKATSLAFRPDAAELAVADHYGAISLWSVQEAAKTTTLVDYKTPVTSLAYSPDGKRLASASLDGNVAVWNLTADAGPRAGPWAFPGPVHHLIWSKDSKHLITANANGTAFVLRIPSP